MLTRLTKAIVACAVLAPASALALPVTVDFTITADESYGPTYNGYGAGTVGYGSFTIDDSVGSFTNTTTGVALLDFTYSFLGATFDESNAFLYQLGFDGLGNVTYWGVGAQPCSLTCIYGSAESPTDFFAYGGGFNEGHTSVHVGGVYYFGGGEISWTQRPNSVPEPATLGLLGLGLLGMGLARRKRAV